MNPLLRRLGEEAMESSLPLVRPLWMLNPEDEVKYRVVVRSSGGESGDAGQSED